jgi:hypothetical protein
MKQRAERENGQIPRKIKERGKKKRKERKGKKRKRKRLKQTAGRADRAENEKQSARRRLGNRDPGDRTFSPGPGKGKNPEQTKKPKGRRC